MTASCDAEVQRIVTIRGDYAGRAGLALVTEDNVLTVNNSDRASIHVFDRSGEHQRTVGGEGDGPGEFRSIVDIRQMPDGRIAVFDQRALRVAYFTPALTVQSTHRLPVSIGPHGAEWDSSGGWYLAGRMIDRDHFGSPVVHVTEDGSVSTYFGEHDPGGEERPAGMIVHRVVAHDPSHGLFTLRGNQYFLEGWAPDGTLARTIEPAVDWFSWPPPWMEDRPAEEGGGVVGDREPENAFLDMQLSASGRLWTLSQVTPPTWREGLSNGRVVDYAAWTDNVLHVLDVSDGTEVCMIRFEDIYVFGGFAGPGILKSYEEDRLGQPTVTFWKVTM